MGKTTFNFHGMFHIDAAKNDSAGEPRSFERFFVVYIICSSQLVM